MSHRPYSSPMQGFLLTYGSEALEALDPHLEEILYLASQPQFRDFAAEAPSRLLSGFGPHMFTLSLEGRLTVPELLLERNASLPGNQYRLFLSMKVCGTVSGAGVCPPFILF